MRKHANAAKTKIILFIFAVFICICTLVFANGVEVQAQNLSDIFKQSTMPVDYDQPRQLGRGAGDPSSIDECLRRKEFFFNEIHNIWVEGMVRCQYNANGSLAATTFYDFQVPTTEEKEMQCYNRNNRAIVQNGSPSESQARYWSEHCSYLGTVGGAGPIVVEGTTGGGIGYPTGQIGGSGTQGVGAGTPDRVDPPVATDTAPGATQLLDPTERARLLVLARAARTTSLSADDQVEFDRLRSRYTAGNNSDTLDGAMILYQRAEIERIAAMTPVYRGRGIEVPSPSTVPGGISQEQSLSRLIVFYTNATLPYVSVVSIFVFVAAGIFYIVSFTNEELNTKAKKMMIYVVIGMVIIFSAYTIVNTLLRLSELGG